MASSTPHILVLADDLTGAAEIGGVALQFGLTARILISLPENRPVPENVTIIDTGSRGFEPEQACRAIREMIKGHDLEGYDLVYKKVDSVLRGPVIAETRALLTVSFFDRVLMIPANPSRNRIIRDGRYFIDGIPLDKTGFRIDPLHPRLSATIRELLNKDEAVVTGNDPALLEEGKIFVPDVVSVEDIRRLLSAAYRPGVLLAGGSDLFRSALAVVMHLVHVRDPELLSKPASHHFIIGSSSETSAGSISRLWELGYTVCALPEAAIRNESSFLEWTVQMGKMVKNGTRVVVSGPAGTVEDPEDAGKISGKVARAARVVAENAGEGTHLFLEGGETASAFFREMGWDQLIISQVHDTGVVTLKPEGVAFQVTVKPGSYPWPQSLMRSDQKPDHIR